MLYIYQLKNSYSYYNASFHEIFRCFSFKICETSNEGSGAVRG